MKKKPKKNKEVMLYTTSSIRCTWNAAGECSFQEDDGPVVRRVDLDYGTPTGDLLVNPWLQDAVKVVPE